MPGQRIDRKGNAGTEHIVVLELLRDDRPQRWTRRALERDLHDIDPRAITAALEHLRELGLVCLQDGKAWASEGLRHLDALGFICI
jgi:hypothetical protein